MTEHDDSAGTARSAGGSGAATGTRDGGGVRGRRGRAVRGGRWAGALLAPAGRMALSHYLAQSLVMALVFTGYGAGYYGRFGTAAVVAGCFGLYAAQLAISGWQARRFRYGPAEWLLRAATLARKP